MTTFFEQRVTCAVCGHDTEFPCLGSTNEMGSPDLDTRPSEMARSTMGFWLQECPSCGYCSEYIGEVSWGARVIVESAAFADFRDSLSGLPDLARIFRTAAYIAAERGLQAKAFHHTLHEAWVHDDLEDSVRATAARLNAVDFMNLAHQEYETVVDEDGVDDAVKIDLLRRAGEFERATKICEEFLQHTRHTGVGPVVAFELELCGKRDVEVHTMDEVPDRSRRWG